ncbi:hypothetical protein A2807_01015 [Candidatus Berkelbacteria bacterium RIFCSPHIGHO2_01_FULL_50_36]|nr:MAG: hypothetical protein A2807_01015 [Candidatus Berkelbacteria bacterium RIFCSPHIGHO2_01_FULL_50_36]
MRWVKFRRVLKRHPGLFLIAGAVVVCYIGAVVWFSGRVLPRVYVGEVKLGGLTYEQTVQTLAKFKKDSVPASVNLLAKGKTSRVKPTDIGWKMDVEKTAKKVYELGRRGSSSLFYQFRAPFAKTTVVPIVDYDAERLEAVIKSFTVSVDEPAIDASATLVDGKVVPVSDQQGEVIDLEGAKAKILDHFSNFHGGDIALESVVDYPKIVLGSAALLQKSVQELAKTELTLTWEGGKKKLSKNGILSLVGFVGKVQGGASDLGLPKVLTAAFTDARVQSYLSSISGLTDDPVVEPKLAIVDKKLTVLKAAKAGRMVDLKKSSAKILLALRKAEQKRTVALILRDRPPTIDVANLGKLGIIERIGYGETSFYGSPPNRVHNITRGVEILQSALIRPRREFSTTGTLGAVDNTTGYLPELVIKEKRTVPEYGGGLCQVSTTLFRAILDAGLKVTERTAHAYRVPYYEPPVGLDATIYMPKPDLRFLNDTPGNILIQGQVVGNKVIFELWGTSDGRKSTIGTPRILSTTKPGEAIYAKTDTLPEGEIKQVELAHDGAAVLVDYVVTRNGKTIIQTTFKSVYQAWPARYLVGTKKKK